MKEIQNTTIGEEVIDIQFKRDFIKKAFKCFNPEDDMVRNYGSDLNKELLITQLSTLHSTTDKESISDLTSVFFYLVIFIILKLAKLILVMPAMNALSERSFSALGRIKTLLRSTIKQVRLK